MEDPDDLTGVISHATELASRGVSIPVVRALAKLAELARAHLETLDQHRNFDAGECEALHAEHRLRTALYGAPDHAVVQPEPPPGRLVRAWRWLVRGWSP